MSVDASTTSPPAASICSGAAVLSNSSLGALGTAVSPAPAPGVSDAVRRTSGSRVAWIDIAKGIGILLVVYGHVARGLVDAGIQPRGGGPVTAASLIYTFHMPLFFLLAGLWVPRAVERPFSRFLTDKVRTILYPYLVWSILQLTVNVAMARFTNGTPQPFRVLEIAFRPYAQFWFLYVLFLNLALAVLLLRLPFGIGIAFFTGVVLYAVHPLMENSIWSIPARVGETFIYVVVGAAFQSQLARLSDSKTCRVRDMAVGLVALGLLMAGFFFANDWSQVLAPLAAMLGIVAVVGFALSVRGTRFGSVLQGLGICSLEIYVAHVMGAAGMRIILSKSLGVFDSRAHLVIDCLAGVAFPLFLCWAASRYRAGWTFTLRARRPVY